jgi:hypothetical protein
MQFELKRELFKICSGGQSKMKEKDCSAVVFPQKHRLKKQLTNTEL